MKKEIFRLVFFLLLSNKFKYFKTKYIIALKKLKSKFFINIHIGKIYLKLNSLQIDRLRLIFVNYQFDFNNVDFKFDIIKYALKRNYFIHTQIESINIKSHISTNEKKYKKEFNLKSRSLGFENFIKKVKSILFQRVSSICVKSIKISFIQKCSITDFNLNTTGKFDFIFSHQSQRFHFQGVIDDENGTIQSNVVNSVEKGIFNFKSCCVQLSIIKQNGINNLLLIIRISDVEINYQKISSKVFFIRSVELNLSLVINKNDAYSQESWIILEGETLPIYAKFRIDKGLIFKFIIKCCLNASSFQDILQKNFFSNLYKLKFNGDISFLLTAAFIKNKELKHKLNALVSSNSLEVVESNEFDLFFLNQPFIYMVKKNGILERQLFLSSFSPNFVELKNVPDVLIKAFVLSEDPNFFIHKGIDIGFLNSAISSNIDKKSFKKGGSTITMQLVKNIFLSQKKNMVRKIEEIIISLLIENIFLVSKHRILEIYLNIIELGPCVYGIKDGAKYYFSKPIADLSLSEIITLTYIIPRPLHFNEALLLRSKQLSQNLKNHFTLLYQRLKSEYRIPNNLIQSESLRYVQFSERFNYLKIDLD